MKVEFLKKFSKDLDDVRNKSTKESVIRIIELLETLTAWKKFQILKS